MNLEQFLLDMGEASSGRQSLRGLVDERVQWLLCKHRILPNVRIKIKTSTGNESFLIYAHESQVPAIGCPPDWHRGRTEHPNVNMIITRSIFVLEKVWEGCVKKLQETVASVDKGA